MSDPDDMPRANLNDEKLKTQKAYAKYLEAKNYARAIRAKKLLHRKRFMFCMCWGIAFGVYGLTIIGMKDQPFLDDFEEPPRKIKEE